jgi:4-aminobutyrate aminotransferase/(S)-3-amino-2-methylpropionate transaminase
MAREDLASRAARIGAMISDRMRQLQQRYPQIGDVRELGAMVAIELVKDPETKAPAKDEVGQIIQACFKRGVLTMGAGIFGNVIRFLPPLVITDDQLNVAMDAFAAALAEVLDR